MVGPKTFANLLTAFEDIDGIYAASVYKLSQVKGVSQKKAERIHYALRDDSAAKKEFDLADRLGVQILTLESDEYPILLKQIDESAACTVC